MFFISNKPPDELFRQLFGIEDGITFTMVDMRPAGIVWLFGYDPLPFQKEEAIPVIPARVSLVLRLNSPPVHCMRDYPILLHAVCSFDGETSPLNGL
jgi:hypothetical protein